MAALTCDETPEVSPWLREAADWLDGLGSQTPQPPPAPLTFIEPNLGFRITPSGQRNLLLIEVDLDLEFRPPPRIRALRRKARTPYTVSSLMHSAAIRHRR